MNYMSIPLKLPKLNKEQKQQQAMSFKKCRENKKKMDPGYQVLRNERNEETARIRKEEGRTLKMDSRNQVTLPSRLLSGQAMLAYGKDVTDMVTTKMESFGKDVTDKVATVGDSTLEKISAFGMAVLDKAFAAEGVSAEEEKVEQAASMEEDIMEKEPNVVTDHAFKRAFDRGVNHDQVVETLTYGEEQGNDEVLYPHTHKLVGKQVTLVVDDYEPENIVSTWPNTHKHEWHQAPCPPAPCLRVQEGETPGQAEERMAKEIKALFFWQKGQMCSKFLSKLETKDAEIDYLHRRSQRLEEQLEDERYERSTMERRIEGMADANMEDLQFLLDCEEHANGYLQSQLDMATEFLSAEENEGPAKKRKRMSYN